MTGADFAADGHRLALAYAHLRPDGLAWLADERAAADELMEWELEGHPFTNLPLTPLPESKMQTVSTVIEGVLALYAKPGTWTAAGIAQDAAGRPVAASSPDAVAWSLEGALERVIGVWEDPDVEWAENERRQRLLVDALATSGVDLMAFNDSARSQKAVVMQLRTLV